MAIRGGRYEILGTIASGGMASVHLARALGAGGFERLVAVKTMHPHLAKEAEFVAMFMDEARLAARIRHPNVVGTLDIQQDEGGLFLVMEYVEGPSLARMLRALGRNKQRLPIEIGLRVFLDTLAGLHAAHELTGHDGEPLRLIHRDMSPHNVLVGVDGVVRITDFGIARAESRLASTRTGSLKGKTMYMAPEQVKSEPLDRRTDLYAAGAVLWEMLTGERLVRSDSELGMMHQIIEGKFRSPTDVDPEVPEDISRACMRALDRKPDLRYSTAMEFAEAVEKACHASGIVPATPRVVGEFVRKLAVHGVALDAPVAPTSSSMPDLTNGVRAPASMPTASEARQAVTSAEPPPPSINTRASFASPLSDSPPRLSAAPSRSRKGLFIAAATLAGIGIGAGWLVLGRTAPSGSGDIAGASGPPSSAPTSLPAPSADASQSATAPSASAPVSDSPASSASAPASASTAKPGKTAPTASGRPVVPRNGRTFRPKEL